MKKNYFMLAAAAAMFAACAETDLVNEAIVAESNASQTIGFETFSNKATRHSTATTLETYHADFGVWAYKTVASTPISVMSRYQVVAEEVVVDGNPTTKWVYDGKGTNQTLKYWDKTASKYGFYAYAPYSTDVTIDGNYHITIPVPTSATYAATENLQKVFGALNTTAKFGTDTDWMLADAIDNHTAYTATEVQENFKHIMSKLIVAVQKGDADPALTVNSISITGNTFSKGKYAWNGVEYAWSELSDPETLVGTAGTISGNDPYYVMEYLLLPTTAPALQLTLNYTVGGTPMNVTKPVGIDVLAANTLYKVIATIGTLGVEFTTQVANWDEKYDDSEDI